METQTTTTQLCSLSEWSVRHIRDVFEARTDEQSLRAISTTFSDNVQATVNGTPLSREGISQMVLAMRRSSPGGLKVHWRHAVEAPSDPTTNRSGSFGGVYVIRGIQKTLPGSSKAIEFERVKTVTVRIESQSSPLHYDSRRITILSFVASDNRVDRQASL
ncbi:hypothetical protein Hypma_006724 [Hypsizygus marmoreus]|uniref:SnoaL-like domain-containing protein n=1 Tax=Hypsizygus marmoreus TaxID=39966 RepID=A0A369JZN5_HYPMA|nr:hypothetical protein Hypma_006724 [Hypsizygus marmoreus]